MVIALNVKFIKLKHVKRVKKLFCFKNIMLVFYGTDHCAPPPPHTLCTVLRSQFLTSSNHLKTGILSIRCSNAITIQKPYGKRPGSGFLDVSDDILGAPISDTENKTMDWELDGVIIMNAVYFDQQRVLNRPLKDFFWGFILFCAYSSPFPFVMVKE